MSARIAVELRPCLECRTRFEPRQSNQLYCREACKVAHREAAEARRERRYRLREPPREPPQKVREYDAVWFLPAPEYAPHLPGGGFTISIVPALKWPLEIRNIRLLHAAMTEITDVPHDPMMPQFALIPSAESRSQWSVWIADEAVARRLAKRAWPVRIGDQSVAVVCGAFTRLRSPVAPTPGPQLLRIDCLTPVVIRSMGSTVFRVDPTAGNLLSTLSGWLPRRLGLEIQKDSMRLVVRHRHTETVRFHRGGKYRHTLGFQGWIEVEANATARWLLDVAGRGLGLGGQTAYGMGRIRVSEVTE